MQVYIGDKYGNESPNSKLLYCNVSLIDPLDSFIDPEYVPPDPRTLKVDHVMTWNHLPRISLFSTI